MYRFCVSWCVWRVSFGIGWRPVGNADSISGGLGLAEQMVCMIGPYQLQGDRQHTEKLKRWTEIVHTSVSVCVVCEYAPVSVVDTLGPHCPDN